MANWVTIYNAAELPQDRPVTVRVNERDLALVRCTLASLPHVVDNRCPHRGGQQYRAPRTGEKLVQWDYPLPLRADHPALSIEGQQGRQCISGRRGITDVAAHRGEVTYLNSGEGSGSGGQGGVIPANGRLGFQRLDGD